MSDSAAITHGVQACYDNGESWNLVCDCQWECWEQPDEETARKLHTRHVADETHPNQREVLRWRMVQEENRVRAEQRETCKRSAASVRPADDKWGCAYERCLEKARVFITTAKGEFGACGKHAKAVRSLARFPAASSDLSDEEVLAMWRRGELVVRTGRIHHGNLCVCPERGDGEWCDKCEGYALEQGR